MQEPEPEVGSVLDSDPQARRLAGSCTACSEHVGLLRRCVPVVTSMKRFFFFFAYKLVRHLHTGGVTVLSGSPCLSTMFVRGRRV